MYQFIIILLDHYSVLYYIILYHNITNILWLKSIYNNIRPSQEPRRRIRWPAAAKGAQQPKIKDTHLLYIK